MSDSDRVRGALARMIKIVFSRIDYLAIYPAKSVSQNDDGTLELMPDDSRMPGLSRVPIRYGIPGVTAKVNPGARVALAFEGGDPARPVATVWEGASVSELQVTVADAGKVHVAAGAGGSVSVSAGAGGSISLAPGVGGSIKLGGDGATLAVALQGDTAGPYPLVCKGMVIKGALGP